MWKWNIETTNAKANRMWQLGCIALRTIHRITFLKKHLLGENWQKTAKKLNRSQLENKISETAVRQKYTWVLLQCFVRRLKVLYSCTSTMEDYSRKLLALNNGYFCPPNSVRFARYFLIESSWTRSKPARFEVVPSRTRVKGMSQMWFFSISFIDIYSTIVQSADSYQTAWAPKTNLGTHTSCQAPKMLTGTKLCVMLEEFSGGPNVTWLIFCSQK